MQAKSFILFILLTIGIGHSIKAQEKSFFSVKQINNKWHIIDPDGKIFHMRGMLHFGDGTHMPWNLEEKYGSVENWRKSVKQQHIDMGFTFLPPSIGPSAIEPATLGDKPKTLQNLITRTPEWPAEHYAELNYPFTAFLEVPKQYMAGNDLPDVWGDEFINTVDKRCREFVAPLKNNRNLIGYHFTQNPPWNMNAQSADLWIKQCVKPGTAGMKEWIKLMKQIYCNIERWRQTYGTPIKTWDDIENMTDALRGYVFGNQLRKDKEAFLMRICEQWYKVYHDAIRKYDPNHLILGDRNTLHLQDAPRPWALFVMSKYIDVLSVNVMGKPSIVYGVLEEATRNWNGPIFLSDTGAGIYNSEPPKSTFQAKDLAEFEEVYSGLVQMSIEHPQIVGFGWCGYYETPHPGGRAGLIDVATDEPLPELLPVITKWNSKMSEYISELNK